MGSIKRSFANNLTTNGVITSSAVNNTSVSNVTSLPSSISAGEMVLISTQTASASSSISFTSGIDSTYDIYFITYISVHPSTDNNASFQFNGSTDGGSTYAVTKTTTKFQAYHPENNSATGLDYTTSNDLAQSTSYQVLNEGANLSADADHGMCGYLYLYNPSSTTYVKHFMARSTCISGADYALDVSVSGHFNTTSAVNAINFQMSSGNLDYGIFKLYGVKTS